MRLNTHLLWGGRGVLVRGRALPIGLSPRKDLRLVNPTVAKHIASSAVQRLRQDPRIPGGNEFNYEEVVRSFQWEVPEKFNFSRDVIDKFAREAGERPALWYTKN